MVKEVRKEAIKTARYVAFLVLLLINTALNAVNLKLLKVLSQLLPESGDEDAWTR